MKRSYQILLLAVLVLAAFYPAVLAGASRIDDFTMLQSLERVTGWNLRTLFFPSASGGYYYRPLIALSYVFDKQVLGLLPGLMHLENILMHLMNAILVYYLASLVSQKASPQENSNSLLPLTAAVLFGLHPVNSESVNWISGRTDILAGIFILSSALLLLYYGNLRKRRLLVFSIIAFLFGVLTKETAIAYLPGFLMLMSRNHSTAAHEQRETGQWHHHVRGSNTIIILGAIAVVLLAVLFRSIAFTSNTSRIGITINAISTDWLHSLLVVLRAFGFYMKKLVVPYPLNFAIMEVDPLYEVLAVPMVVFCMFIALHRTVPSVFFLTGVFLILPAFLIAFGQIAWTPYAERYLYLPSAFITVAAVVSAARFVPARRGLVMKTAVAALVMIMFVTTFGRSLVWQNDFDLVKDTVEKSPQSRDMRTTYGAMLAERGEYDRALMELQHGSSISLLGVYDERIDQNRAFIAYRQGRIDDAIDIYNLMLQKTDRRSIIALENMVRLLEAVQDDSLPDREQRRLSLKILTYNEELYHLTRDPHLAYRIGKDAAALGQYQKALLFYRRSYDGMAAADPYRSIVMKRISKLPVYAHDERIHGSK